MLSFRENSFFIKFSILFFIITIFGYWGIDLNSEELYIAFSFFFLVIVAFSLVRTGALLFFTNTVNRKYVRLFIDLNRIRILLNVHAQILAALVDSQSTIKARLLKFLAFSPDYLIKIARTAKALKFLKLHRRRVTLALNINAFVIKNARLRRFSGFFENSSRFFSVLV
jgi:hypothetical protein